jgi:hypothetical protein
MALDWVENTMSRNLFSRYSKPIGGPGLMAAAYALPTEIVTSSVGLKSVILSSPDFVAPTAEQIPERGIGISYAETAREPSVHDVQSPAPAVNERDILNRRDW